MGFWIYESFCSLTVYAIVFFKNVKAGNNNNVVKKNKYVMNTYIYINAMVLFAAIKNHSNKLQKYVKGLILGANNCKISTLGLSSIYLI